MATAILYAQVFCRECGYHGWEQFTVPIIDGSVTSPIVSCPYHTPKEATVFWNIYYELEHDPYHIITKEETT